MTDRYAVLIDKTVPGVAYGPVLLLGRHIEAIAVGHFTDLRLAKIFTESMREYDTRLGLGLGRLRVYDHETESVVHELPIEK